MDEFSGLSRRNFVKAGLGAVGAVAVPASAAQALSPAPGLLTRNAQTRTLTFTAGTNASVAVSPAGDQLIAEIQGVLWALPRRGGVATALTDPELEPTRIAWSPDGSRIAICAYRGGGFHVWTMAPDGTGLRQLTSGPWDDRGVAWSPDGTRIAFSSERGGDPTAGSSYRIWTVDVQSGVLKELTSEPAAEDYDPAWYPDGSRVLFVRSTGQGGRALASVSADGGAVNIERTVDTGSLLCPAISANGRIAYVQLPDVPQSTVAAYSTLMVDGEPVSADGEDVSPLPPSWTARGELLYIGDGQIRARRPGKTANLEQIPFTAALGVARPQYRKKVHDFDSTLARQVHGVHLPTLAPDGESIAFVALNALWVLPIGGRPRKLVQAEPTAYIQMPAWAPDGRSVLYSYDGGAEGIELISVHRHWLKDGRDEVLATGGRVNPALSPDGTRLACHDTTGNLIVRDLDTGQERTLVAALGANGIPGRASWSPDGRYLAFCDRNRLNKRFREGYNLIRVVDADTGAWTAHLPAPHASLSDRGNAGPVWSPDGSSMAFIMESALWVLPVEPDGTPAGEPRRITDEAADHPSWSGNSRTLLYESAGRLRLIRADGTKRRSIHVPLNYRRRLPSRSGITRVHAGRLWDGTSESVRTDVDIVIRANRIIAVEPHRSDDAGPADTLIDASTSTVIPGLWDSHTHPWQYTYGGRQSTLMLAYGITTNVSLGGFAHEAVRIRESVIAGRMAGPRLFATGELIDGSRVAYSMSRAHRTSDGVRRSLERAVALEYDFVKTYVRAPAWTMRQAAQTAHTKLGVLSGSHLLSPGISVGQDLTTHLHATQRSDYGRALSPAGHSYQDVQETYAEGDFKLIVTPFSAIALLPSSPALATDPRITALMPPWDAALVNSYATTPVTPAAEFALNNEIGIYTRIMAAGGTVVLGTDAPLAPTGLHLHLALRALHRNGGLSAAQALRTATVVPAELFGVSADLGTVEVGKLADLVAVDGNPFDDFDDLVRTSWAMRDGIVHRPDDLVAAANTDPQHQRTMAETDWLAVARQIRREPCCSEHALSV